METKIKKGMTVYIDSKCRATKKAYGSNDDMELNFFGKQGVVASDPDYEPIAVRGIASPKIWNFKIKDLSISPFVSFPVTEKPKEVVVKFNPENL